jgi:phage terminase Nu1 subunit (DNA packaging protein)
MSEELSAEAWGAFVNLDKRRVQQLADEGVISKSGRGRYPLAEVTNYIRYLQELVARRKIEPERPAGGLDPEQQKARKDAADADLKELQLAEKRGLMVNAAEFKAEHLKALTAVRAGVLSIGVRVAEEVAMMGDARKARARIDKEAWEILENLSQYGSETTDQRIDEHPTPTVKRAAKRVVKQKSNVKPRVRGNARKVSD